MFTVLRRPIALIIACGVLLSACAPPRQVSRDGSEGITVVAGFYPLAELAHQIGRDRVEVINLTPAGAEAHDLELAPSQVEGVLDADLVLLVGGGFQPALEKAVERRGGRALDLAVVSQDDPHFWLDPVKFATAVPKVRAALTDLAPASAASFQRAADSYAAALGDLHGEFTAGLAECERRTFVTTHAAFGHLAESYDLRQESISGLSPESEPDPGRLSELADRIEELGVTTVFVEPLAPRAAAATLAREANVGIAELDPLESLRPNSDSDYLAVMRANLAALRNGLGCR